MPPIDRRLLDLQLNQDQKRISMGHFQSMEMDELDAIRKFAVKCFGRASERFTMPDGSHRWGGLLETGPDTPGIIYVGYYIDPPHVPPAKRRRKLVFYGAKISELEAQAKVYFQ